MDMNRSFVQSGCWSDFFFFFTGMHKYGVSLHVRDIWKNLCEIKEKT